MKIIIVGCGQVGRTLADELNREDNEVTIIDRRYAIVEEISNKYDVMGGRWKWSQLPGAERSRD